MGQSTGSNGAPSTLTIFAVGSAAVLGLTLQPVIAIADPVALLIVGMLVVLVVLGFAAGIAEALTAPQELFFSVVTIAALIAMGATVGDAWREQRSIKATCSRLQHVMLYEHRKRTDVPEIFRSLACKIQG